MRELRDERGWGGWGVRVGRHAVSAFRCCCSVSVSVSVSVSGSAPLLFLSVPVAPRVVFVFVLSPPHFDATFLGSPHTRSPQLKHTSARNPLLPSRAQRIELPSKGSKRWSCPHCTYVQKNHRRPDLKRHIAGHFPDNRYVCCGVPVHLAAKFGVPASAECSEWQGEEMVGGCWLVFSRRDALIRHLKNPKKDCVNNEVLPEKVL